MLAAQENTRRAAEAELQAAIKLDPGNADYRVMLAQLFNVFNARSDERSAFVHAFRNAWLWTAIAGSVAMQVVVVHVPFLQNAFGTTSLNVSDWILCIAVASSVLWLREGSKAVIRRKRPHV